jgi:hypothetical protein
MKETNLTVQHEIGYIMFVQLKLKANTKKYMTLQHKYKHEHKAFGVEVQINSLCLINCT